MPREDYRTKGARYAVEGRLIVAKVGNGVIEATCHGGGQVYELGFQGGQWFCTCEARTTCSHLYALQLVTLRPDAAATTTRLRSA